MQVCTLERSSQQNLCVALGLMALFCTGPQWHGMLHPSPIVSPGGHTSSVRWEVHIFPWRFIHIFTLVKMKAWKSNFGQKHGPFFPVVHPCHLGDHAVFRLPIKTVSPHPFITKCSVCQPLSCARLLLPACCNTQALRRVASHSFKDSLF